MHEFPLLSELLVVIFMSLVVVCALRRLKVPPVVGFLVAGALIGPGGLGLISDRETVEVLAELGVVLLLFTIGLKFSIQEVLRLKAWVLGAGSLQVLLTIGAVMLYCQYRGLPATQGAFYGFLAALSSTAIVLKLQEEHGDTNTPYGRFSVSLLIFQDIAVVPMLLLVPMLGAAETDWGQVAWGLGRSLLLLAAIALAARLIFPRLLEAVVGTRSPEVFTLTVILVAMGTAYISGEAGLSLALGAFLAGVIISETHYSHHVTAQIMPLRDTLSSLFFVSIGMLVQPAQWLSEPLIVVGGAAGLLLLKALVVCGIVLVFGIGIRSALATALSLAQVGEFSFVLAGAGLAAGLLPQSVYESFVSISVLTMAATPPLISLGRRLAGRSGPLARMEHRVREGLRQAEEAGEELEEETLEDHVILVGYGVNGRNVGRALDTMGVDYIVLELNPNTARELRESGKRVIYGDACQEGLLKLAQIHTARAMVISIADAVAARCVAAIARTQAPNLHVIVRTRFVAEVAQLQAQGVDAVVPEEFETSLQLVALVMEAYGAPHRAIEREKDLIRSENYAMLTGGEARSGPPLAGLLRIADLGEAELGAESPAVGGTLRGLDLRARTGALVVAIVREDELLANPDPDLPLEMGDTLVFYGEEAALQAVRGLLGAGEPA